MPQPHCNSGNEACRISNTGSCRHLHVTYVVAVFVLVTVIVAVTITIAVAVAVAFAIPVAIAEILVDPYSKKSPLPRIGNFHSSSITPRIPSHRILGNSRILNRISTSHNYPRRALLE
jgi:hypothetical protein